jgi:N-acetylmuramoyl-L-alanine amidase
MPFGAIQNRQDRLLWRPPIQRFGRVAMSVISMSAVSMLPMCVWLAPAAQAAPALTPAPASTANAPVAVDARLADDGGPATLTFDLSLPVEAHAFSMVDPDRIVVDVPEVNFQIDPAVGRAPQGRSLGKIIKSFRFGLLAPGKSRIVIDLAAPAQVTGVTTQPIVEGAPPARLRIELSKCERSAFLQSVKDSESPAPDSRAHSEAPVHAPLTIVLDPGHGGVDSGAIGLGGAVEKTIVFEFTSELAKKLEASGRYHVVLTRDGDQFVSLADRVKLARDVGAALLISIHADTLHAAEDVSGATVYTVADRASDAEAARIAERENAADKAAGVEQTEEAAGVADILFDLKRRETRAYAHLFSRGIVEEWKSAGRLNHNPERSAGFVVLKAPDYPSVLLELGYLSSPQDLKSMNSPVWRNRATTALVTAVDRFFTPHSSATPHAAEANAGAASPAVAEGSR